MDNVRAAKAAAITLVSYFSVMFVFWWTQIRRFWAPGIDEFPLIVNSTVMYHPHPLRWLTEGYGKYFIVYPELMYGKTNFLRPVSNLFYFLCSLVLRDHYTYYLLCDYFLFALLAAGLVWVAVQYFEFSNLQAAVLALFAFFSPATDGLAHFYPDGCLDMIGAMFLIWTLKFFLDGKLRWAFVLVTFAVFIKETTHFAPFAISVCLFLFSARPLTARIKAAICLFPLPVVALYTLRKLDFKSGTVYATGGFSVRAIPKSMLHWPLHIFVDEGRALPPGHLIRLERDALFVCCALFWVLLVWVCGPYLLKVYRDRQQSVAEPVATRDVALATTAMFLAGTLALPALLQLPARFGALVFPLLALLGIYFVNHSSEMWRRLAWVVCLLALVVTSAQARYEVVAPKNSMKPAFDTEWSYLKTIQSAPPGVLLSVDDMNGGATERWVPLFTRYQGDFVPINTMRQMERNCWEPSAVSRESATVIRIDFTKYGCEWTYLVAINKTLPRVWTTRTGNVETTYTSDEHAQILFARVTVPEGVPVSVIQSNALTNRYRLIRAEELPLYKAGETPAP